MFYDIDKRHKVPPMYEGVWVNESEVLRIITLTEDRNK
jgi:hypothetical protein